MFYIRTPSILIREVATLAHEVGNDPMEWTSFITETRFTDAQSSEVLGSLGCHIRFELDHNPT